MIFGWRKKKHPLPRFPDTVRSNFHRLKEALAPDEAAELLPQLAEHLEEIRNHAKRNSLLDLGLAIEIGNACRYLLEHYEEYSPGERELVIAAVRYFAISEDSMDEEAFASGFIDDGRVLNHVLEELGLSNLIIEVHR